MDDVGWTGGGGWLVRSSITASDLRLNAPKARFLGSGGGEAGGVGVWVVAAAGKRWGLTGVEARDRVAVLEPEVVSVVTTRVTSSEDGGEEGGGEGGRSSVKRDGERLLVVAHSTPAACPKLSMSTARPGTLEANTDQAARTHANRSRCSDGRRADRQESTGQRGSCTLCMLFFLLAMNSSALSALER